MIIGIDVREAAVGRRAGKGRVVHELLPRLAKLSSRHTWLLFTDRRFDWDLPPNCRWRVMPGKRGRWHRRVAKAAVQACDLYFAPTSYLTSRYLKIPTILFVHDLVAFSKARSGLKATLIERVTLRRALRQAAAVLVNSQTTADDLQKRFRKLPPVTVAPLAAGAAFSGRVPAAKQKEVRARYQLPKRYLLSVGTIEPRKNQAALIAAFEKIPAAKRGRPPAQLVIAGRWGWRYRKVKQAMRSASATRIVDGVTDADLPAVYAGATALAYPSRYEGFGLPVVEAMQSGLPVLVSETPALRELAGEAALYCDPNKPESIRKGLVELLTKGTRRRQLATAGRKRAKDYSWDRTARAAWQAISSIM